MAEVYGNLVIVVILVMEGEDASCNVRLTILDDMFCCKLDKLSGQLKKLSLLVLLPSSAIPEIPVIVVKAISGLISKLGCIDTSEIGLTDMLRPTSSAFR